MNFATPETIADVAWQGELVAPENSFGPKSPSRPLVTIGQIELWRAEEALETEVGKKWTPPLGDANYWLVRLACTLHGPDSMPIGEAQQTLALRPRNPRERPEAVYAFSLFPERLTAEQKGELSAALGPELKFGDAASLKAGQLSAKIELRKVYPVIQSYGAGEPTPYWIFKAHASQPIEGTQFVYAVIVDRAGADGVQADVDITVTAQSQFGPIRYGSPRELRRKASWLIQ
jgi:hypothetical protein